MNERLDVIALPANKQGVQARKKEWKNERTNKSQMTSSKHKALIALIEKEKIIVKPKFVFTVEDCLRG